MQRGPGIAAEPVVPAAARAEVGTDKDAAVIGDHPDDGLCRRLAVLRCRFDPNLGLPAQPGQVSRRKDYHGSEMKSSISRQALPNALSLRTGLLGQVKQIRSTVTDSCQSRGPGWARGDVRPSDQRDTGGR